jgi:hypothetical protein
MNVTKEQLNWILGSDTGISSKTIFSVMTGSALERADVPYDGDDFGRCYRLLVLFPEWRSRLQEVSDQYKEWGPLVREWDKLTEEYIEAKNSPPPHFRTWKTLYEHMSQLIDEGRLVAGWTKTGPGCWRGPSRNIQSVEFGTGITISMEIKK